VIRQELHRSRRLGAIIAASVLLAAAAIARYDEQPAGAATAPCTVKFGMYVSGIPWDSNMTAIRNLDTAVNRHSSIVHWFAQWGDSGSGSFSVSQPSMLNTVRNYSSVGVTGATPFISWEPWGPGPYSVANNTFPLQRIAAGAFDDYIDSWANGLRGYGGPVLLDFAHEMDGNWYPWGYGVNGNTPGDFIAAYSRVHERFVDAGATNVQFVWTVDIWNPAGKNPTAFYPGDSNVDWMAIDVYNWGAAGGGWASLSQGLDATQVYSRLAALSSRPIMLAEWASTEAGPGDPAGASKSQWILDAAQAIASKYTRITAAVWFSPSGTPFALDSSPASIAAAKTAFGGC
jgi:beta-mannanase